MTDSDLRELDGWIADNFLNGIRQPICRIEGHSIDEVGDYCSCCRSSPDEAEQVPPRFSSDSAAFARVKREMERRFWDWRSTQRVYFEPHFRFEVLMEHEWDDAYMAEANSEELAGCLAVKAAVESTTASA